MTWLSGKLILSKMSEKPGVTNALQLRYEKEVAAIQQTAATEIARIQEAHQAQRRFAQAEIERLEVEQAHKMSALETRHKREILQVHALESRHAKELAALKQLAATEITRIGVAEKALKKHALAEMGHREAEHLQEVARLEIRHKRERLQAKEDSSRELARLQEILESQKNMNHAERDRVEINQSKSMKGFQARIEKEMAEVRETAALQINQLSIELTGALKSIDHLRKENHELALRPTHEEMERLRTLNSSLVTVIAELRIEQEMPPEEIAQANEVITTLQESLEREQTFAREELAQMSPSQSL